MAMVKISDMQNVSEYVGNEYGQIVQNGGNRKAVLMFSDFDKRQFVTPSGFSIQANSDVGIHNLFELSRDAKTLLIGPRCIDTTIDFGNSVIQELTIKNTDSYGALSTENERKDLISLNSDNKIQIGDYKTGIVFVQGSDQQLTIKRELISGCGEWVESRIIDEKLFNNYLVLNMNSVYTFGTELPNNNDGYPDGHLYIKY